MEDQPKPQQRSLAAFTSDFSNLSEKQHGFLRDAGIPRDNLIGKRQAFYDRVRASLQYKGSNAPATALQLGYLRANGFVIDEEDATFRLCRHAIRKLAKEQSDDPKYLKFIAAYEADNANRNSRARKSDIGRTEPDAIKVEPDENRTPSDDERTETPFELGRPPATEDEILEYLCEIGAK